MFLLGEARCDVFGGIPFGGEATQGMERFPYNTLNAENPGIDVYKRQEEDNSGLSKTEKAAIDPDGYICLLYTSCKHIGSR